MTTTILLSPYAAILFLSVGPRVVARGDVGQRVVVTGGRRRGDTAGFGRARLAPGGGEDTGVGVLGVAVALAVHALVGLVGHGPSSRVHVERQT